MVLGVFIISALISLAIGTSCGTIAALTPIAVSISQECLINSAVMLGAVVGGAMFGDNMSLISDTKIAASRTQNVKIRDEMFANLKIIAFPALICIVLYLHPFFSADSTSIVLDSLSYDNIIKIIPYILLLILGISGINVMFLLLLGIILNTIIGIKYHIFNIYEALGCIGDGTTTMATTLIVALLAGGLLMLVRYNGGITYIIQETQKWIKNKKTCEAGICFLVGLINLFTANNTVAIITSGSIAKELSQKNDINPTRCASLLDTTSCAVQGIIPYGAQILIATSLAQSLSISSFSIMKAMFYPILMIFGIFFSILRTKD